MFWPMFLFPSLLFIFTPCWFEYLCSYGENKEIHRAGKQHTKTREKKKIQKLTSFPNTSAKKSCCVSSLRPERAPTRKGPTLRKESAGGRQIKALPGLERRVTEATAFQRSMRSGGGSGRRGLSGPMAAAERGRSGV